MQVAGLPDTAPAPDIPEKLLVADKLLGAEKLLVADRHLAADRYPAVGTRPADMHREESHQVLGRVPERGRQRQTQGTGRERMPGSHLLGMGQEQQRGMGQGRDMRPGGSQAEAQSLFPGFCE